MHVSAQNASSAPQFEEVAPGNWSHNASTVPFSVLSIKASAILLYELMDRGLFNKNSLTFPDVSR